MENKRLIEQLKAELRQALKNMEEGKGIPRDKFTWPRPDLYIAESTSGRYRVSDT